MAENLVYLCSAVFWEIDLVSDELGYLAEVISKQNMKVGFVALCGLQKNAKGDKLKEEVLNKRNPDLRIQTRLGLSILQKMRM